MIQINMRTLFVVLFMAVSAMSSICQEQAFKQKLAVYMIGDVDESYKKVIGSKMVSEIAGSPDYIAIERTADFLNAISSEYDYQVSGNVTDSQIARIGQQFGVRYVAVVDANELLDEIFVSSRLIDVQSGVIIYSYETSSPVQGMAQLVSLSQNVAKGLIINPKNEERARAKAEQERIEREKQEKIERERRMAQERETSLRQQAINNLISRLGVNVIRAGNYIVMADRCIINYEFNSRLGTVAKTNTTPQGWKMADESVLRALKNAGIDLGGYYTVPYPLPDAVPEIDTSEKCDLSRRLGRWKIRCWSSGSLAVRNYTIGLTVKSKNPSCPTLNKDHINTFATYYYRPMFSEAEIQQEINRIR